MSYETRFLIALPATLLLELPALFLLVRYVFKRGDISTGRLLFVGTIATVLTLPYVWFVIPAFIRFKYWIYVAELFAVAAEGIIYSVLLRMRMRSALLVSLVANTISYLTGLLIFRLVLRML